LIRNPSAIALRLGGRSGNVLQRNAEAQQGFDKLSLTTLFLRIASAHHSCHCGLDPQSSEERGVVEFYFSCLHILRRSRPEVSGRRLIA
jgi:hypothetical protein